MDAPIWYVCPAEGHLVRRNLVSPGKVARGDSHCPKHGVRLFRVCKSCKAKWPFVHAGRGYSRQETGASFCTNCGEPAPWLSRLELIQWLQHQVQASFDVPASTRRELRTILEKLRDMDAGDTKTVAGWKKLRDAAPKVWEMSKPVRDMLMTEAVKRVLGLSRASRQKAGYGTSRPPAISATLLSRRASGGRCSR